ncbi:hypothetical protein VTK73DRAFT_1628 [Phialemonium thermophilum]|uniref:Uncharacterized protein n=1 Tax=Phialemonium thermophilum TaxID=223376 RepID=A0ABR3VT63_9PEZI
MATVVTFLRPQHLAYVLAKSARYAPVPVSLDGKLVSGGYRPSDAAGEEHAAREKMGISVCCIHTGRFMGVDILGIQMGLGLSSGPLYSNNVTKSERDVPFPVACRLTAGKKYSRPCQRDGPAYIRYLSRSLSEGDSVPRTDAGNGGNTRAISIGILEGTL